MSISKNAVKQGSSSSSSSVLGFANWAIPMANGKTYRSTKGFPIFDSPEYPIDARSAKLIELATKHGGRVTITCELTIVLSNGGGDSSEVSVDDFITS
jgi:hypothetical protein